MLKDMRPADVAFTDFNRAPFLVIWEATRACALACVHCRADAMHRRDPRELTTDEACRLIDQVRGFGEQPPLFVLTGGDPMRRPDLTDQALASEVDRELHSVGGKVGLGAIKGHLHNASIESPGYESVNVGASTGGGIGCRDGGGQKIEVVQVIVRAAARQ